MFHTSRTHLIRALRARRFFSISSPTRHPYPSTPSPPPFGNAPAPPRLPEHEQKLFEELQRASTGAFSTPRARPTVNQSPATSSTTSTTSATSTTASTTTPTSTHAPTTPTTSSSATQTLSSSNSFSPPPSTVSNPPPSTPSPSRGGKDLDSETMVQARVKAKGDGEELHPNIRRGAPPEFEGEKNPKTGEMGGPKNEPLRWGYGGDWSYNGRVTDF